MTTNRLLEIKQYGQSIWMDNLTRDLIQSGDLRRMVETEGVAGITSNPAIFQKAIAGNAIYDHDIEAGIRAGQSVMPIYESLIFDDIRQACDILLPVHQQTDGLDGYVSIEVPPDIAHDAEATVREAQRYCAAIDRPNVMIKIPGTAEGWAAVESVIAAGISVNVTLLFSVESYINCAEAYLRGLEARVQRGEAINRIASVASFFLSRIDSNIDAKIDEKLKGIDEANAREKLVAIKGKIAIANAKLAYQEYQTLIASDRWQRLATHGATVQRLLWASTGTKNPDYSNVMYVDELIGPDTVNTLPPNTLAACADHCDPQNRLESGVPEAQTLIDSLADPDIDIQIDQVMAELLDEGIDKFVEPFQSLIQSLQAKIDDLAPVA